MKSTKRTWNWALALGLGLGLLSFSVAPAEDAAFQTNADFFKEFEVYEKKAPPVDSRSEAQKTEARALHAENRRRELFESRNPDVSESTREAFEKGRPTFQWVKDHAEDYLAALHQGEDSADPEESETKNPANTQAVARGKKHGPAKAQVCESNCSNPLEYLKGHPLDPNELVSDKAGPKVSGRKARSARTASRRTKPVQRQDGVGAASVENREASASTPSAVGSTR